MTLTIDVTAIPECGDPVAVQSAAGELQGLAGTISARGSLINSTWQGLKGAYVAPEGGKLISATKPVEARTEHLAHNISGAARALNTFGQALGPIKQRLDELKSDAQAFNSWAWAHPNWEQHPEQYNNTTAVPVPEKFSRDGVSDAPAWHDKILYEIALVGVDLEKAKHDCQAEIQKYVDADVMPAPRAPTRDEAHAHKEWYEAVAGAGFIDPQGLDFPWGSAFKVETANPHPNFAQSFATRFTGDWESMNNFFTSAFGFSKDGWGALGGGHFSVSTLTSTWKGIGRLTFALSGAGVVVPGAAYLGGKATGNKGWVKWGTHNLAANAATVRDLGKGLVGWEGWKEGPAQGLADVGFNAATMVTPGPFKLGGGMLAAKSAALAERAGAARFLGMAMQAPKFLTDGGLPWADIRLGAKGMSWTGEKLGLNLPSVSDWLHRGAIDAHLPEGGVHAPTSYRDYRDQLPGTWVEPREPGETFDGIPKGGHTTTHPEPRYADDLLRVLQNRPHLKPGQSVEDFVKESAATRGKLVEAATHHEVSRQEHAAGRDPYDWDKPPAPQRVVQKVIDAWQAIPESVREKVIEEGAFRGGPLDNTKDLPSDYWAPGNSDQNKAAQAAYAAALAELRAHPEVLEHYLRTQPLEVLLRKL